MDTGEYGFAIMFAYLDKYIFAAFVALLAYLVLKSVFGKRS